MIVRRGAGKCIDSVVLGMAAVAFDPVPLDSVRRCRGDEFLPQLGILDRLLIRGAPPIPLPVVDPPRNAVADILAVCVEFDSARSLQGFQSADRGEQFHAIVRR